MIGVTVAEGLANAIRGSAGVIMSRFTALLLRLVGVIIVSR